jgi:hypothetical protein
MPHPEMFRCALTIQIDSASVCLTDARKDSLSLGEKTSSDGGQDHPPSVSFATDFDVLRHFEFRDEFLAQQLSWICISIRALPQWRIKPTFFETIKFTVIVGLGRGH